MIYADQQAWRDIQEFLPARLRFTADYSPTEHWWAHNGHRIHLDRFVNPDAPARVILFHGVGTNGRQMSLILGGPLWQRGLETVAIDMPGYGVTEVSPKGRVRYDDWVQVAVDFIDSELATDPRPIVLYGLSAGGMLAYHAAAINHQVKGVVGMTFLDQRIQKVRDDTSYNLLLSRVGVPAVNVATRTGLAALRMPMRVASKMHTLVNDPDALKVFLRDRTSAGNSATMTFLGSYMNYVPALEPEDFDVCPILLTQPAQDRWTPLELSDLFLDRITRVPVEKVMLDNAGHYPLEEPGLTQMQDAVEAFVRKVTATT